MRKGQKATNETRLRMSKSRMGNKINIGRFPSMETKRKMSESHKGNSNALGYKHSDETKRKVSLATQGKRKPLSMRQKMTGSSNPAWKGGVTPLTQRLRHSVEYILWRKSVFDRDNYACIWCGDNKGGNLEADHIQKWSEYPELRFAIDNGRTLCIRCHRNRHRK